MPYRLEAGINSDHVVEASYISNAPEDPKLKKYENLVSYQEKVKYQEYLDEIKSKNITNNNSVSDLTHNIKDKDEVVNIDDASDLKF